MPVKQQIARHNMETLSRILACKDIPKLEAVKIPNEGRRIKEKMPSPLRYLYYKTAELVAEDLITQEVIPPFVALP